MCKCPICFGKKIVNKSKCTRCNGTGKVRELLEINEITGKTIAIKPKR